MRLKHRFLYQNIMVILCAVILTGCAGFLYQSTARLFDVPENGEPALIVLENQQVLHNSHDFSMVQIKEILMDVSVKKIKGQYGGLNYQIKWNSFSSENNTRLQVIQLTPIDATPSDRNLFLFLGMFFILVFITGSWIVRKQNQKYIIEPLMQLKEETQKLRLGDLNAAMGENGWDELGELSREIEKLRLKLKDSLYYQQKIHADRTFLVSSISHDLKTPVTAIRGYIDGVLDGVADTPEKKQYYLEKAIAKTKQINVMIEDLLLYSKLDLDEISYQIEPVNIVDYLKDCVEDHSPLFNQEKKRLTLRSEISQSVQCSMDGVKFKRVVQNILDNAKKNIPMETGVVTIILRETASSVVLEFQDNGKGIPKEDLPKIFNRFYRADSARTAEGSSGLGLAIAKQIVEGIGGRIWAMSREGQGTSILISLKKA